MKPVLSYEKCYATVMDCWQFFFLIKEQYISIYQISIVLLFKLFFMSVPHGLKYIKTQSFT